MPENAAERVIRIKAKEASPEGVRAYTIEHEEDQLPDTPEKIASMLKRSLAEIGARNISGKGELSEEAQFVARLEGTIAEFYKERRADLPRDRWPSLSYFVSILDGSQKNISLPPQDLHDLKDRIYDRFGIPAREDLTILQDGEPVKNQPGRIDAHRRVVEGVTESWKKVIQESWRKYYVEQYPARVRGEVEDIATTNSLPRQREIMAELIDRVGRGTPARFRKFMQALIMQSVGMKGTIVGEEDLRAFANFITPRLPEEQPIPGLSDDEETRAKEIYNYMRAAAPNKDAVPVPREVLSRIVAAFASDIRGVYELGNPEKVYDSVKTEGEIFNKVRDTWLSFTSLQKAQYLELVKANYVSVPPKGDEGAKKRENRNITIREELRNQCSKLTRILSGNNPKISDEDTRLLTKLIELRTVEIVDYRTTTSEEEAGAAEAKEQETQSPEELFSGIKEQLAHPNAYIPTMLRTLMRDNMANYRKILLERMLNALPQIGSPSIALRAEKLKALVGGNVKESVLQAAYEVIDAEGKDVNKTSARTGWELLLTATNASSLFRNTMRE